MYDKRLNDQLIRLNKRYQDLLHSEAFENHNKNKRYLKNLTHLEIEEIIRDLKYRKYARGHFSQSGNREINNKQYQNTDDKKIAVYTCIVGNYDKPLEPVYTEPGIDYYIFTDQPVETDSTWMKIDITKDEQYDKISPMLLNRKIKILQNEILKKYDYTVYVDGNIEIVAAISPMIEQMGKTEIGIHYHRTRDCIYDEAVSVKHLKRVKGEDFDKQLDFYRNEGFPEHFGMYENSIIIRSNNAPMVENLMEAWWKEFLKHPTRDQFSLPYIIWKLNYSKERILILGNDIEKNPFFNRIGEHRKKK